MENYAHARARLLLLAGIGSSNESPDLRLVEICKGDLTRLKTVYSDIVRDLELVNIAVNGENPASNTSPRSTIDPTVAYAISRIICELLPTAIQSELETSAKLSRLCWASATAWDAVLAGDFNSVREHIENTALASGIDLSCLIDEESLEVVFRIKP